MVLAPRPARPNSRNVAAIAPSTPPSGSASGTVPASPK